MDARLIVTMGIPNPVRYMTHLVDDAAAAIFQRLRSAAAHATTRDCIMLKIEMGSFLNACVLATAEVRDVPTPEMSYLLHSCYCRTAACRFVGC